MTITLTDKELDALVDKIAEKVQPKPQDCAKLLTEIFEEVNGILRYGRDSRLTGELLRQKFEIICPTGQSINWRELL